METFNAKILKDFGMKCGNVRREKMNYVCSTDLGIVCAQKTSVQPQRVEFIHAVKNVLIHNGFENVDRFFEAENGLPYVIFDGDVYVVFSYIPQSYKETSFLDKEDLFGVVRATAKMHNALINGAKKDSLEKRKLREVTACAEDLPDAVYARNIHMLKRYKKIVSKGPHMSDFDVAFLKNYGFFAERLEEWKETANSELYRRGIETAKMRGDICHNSLKEETTLKMPNGDVFICNFSDADHHSFGFELAGIVSRHLKVSPYDAVPLGEIIEAYNAVNPLSDEEIAVTLAQLIFPDKFLSVCERYYERKRTWSPAAIMGIMDNIAAAKDARKKYVDEYKKNR